MTERTIYIFDKSAISVTSTSGGAPRNGDVIGNALNGDAFSWEVPDDLKLIFPSSTVAITFNDADGVLSDDPYSGSTVVDQQLSQPVTIAGTTYTPSDSTVRWQWPPPVTVEDEYEVTLYDAEGHAYRMVGVSITQGYVTQVVGVTFDGAAPPAGTALYYHQGLSSYTGSGESVEVHEDIPCFLVGTRIDTPAGPRPIESLAVGDRVMTMDHGPQPVRWIGRGRVAGTGWLAPVRIAAGTMGNARDLLVSPNHRILLRAPEAELYFASNEVLVAAKHLVNGATIRRAPRRWAIYLHLAFDRHEMVFSEGIASESLYTGPVALATLDRTARAELRAIFPGVNLARQVTARRILTGVEARVLLSRRGLYGARLGQRRR